MEEQPAIGLGTTGNATAAVGEQKPRPIQGGPTADRHAMNSKKDSDGNWSTNTGNGWQSVEQPSRPAGAGTQSATQPGRPSTNPERPASRPQRPSTQPERPITQPQTTSRQLLDSMVRSRERGSAQTQRTQSFQRSSSSSGGGARSGGDGSRSGGGGGRSGGGKRR